MRINKISIETETRAKPIMTPALYAVLNAAPKEIFALIVVR